jgi:hypothetical protein
MKRNAQQSSNDRSNDRSNDETNTKVQNNEPKLSGKKVQKPKKKKVKQVKQVKHIKPQSDPENHTELIFEDDDAHIPDYVPTNLQPHNTQKRPISGASKFSTTPSKVSPNDSIMAMAKQMEAERARQLNIKNEG